MIQLNSYSKVIHSLKNKLNFSQEKLNKISLFVDLVLSYNKEKNLIGKSTEKDIWSRHVLDSAQIVKFIDFYKGNGVADLGSGAGFPGIILAIFNPNYTFHVKLYEKSAIKCNFLRNCIKKLSLNAEVHEENVMNAKIASNLIVCRAFKKMPELLKISRENADKTYKIIVLKGKNAEKEIKKASIKEKIVYKIAKSITETDSKILIIEKDTKQRWNSD